MRFCIFLLALGHAASTATGWVVDPSLLFYANKAPTANSTNDATCVEPLSAGASFPPLTIDTSVHLVATSDGQYLSQDALDEQMSIINQSFAPYNISFVLTETEHIVNPVWDIGLDEKRMIWDHNRGDAQTLNLYFIERFDKDSSQLGLSYAPQRLSQEIGAYRVDGAIVKYSTIPGAPAWEPARWEGKTVVQAIGYWLGLLHSAAGGCHGPGDSVDDTPASIEDVSVGLCPIGLDSCRDDPGPDPIHNFMSSTSDSCKTEFTLGQADRMHRLWNAFRASHRIPETPLLAPIAPLETEEKLPYYAAPVSLTAALVQCLPYESNEIRETREAYCGTIIYCFSRFGLSASTVNSNASSDTWVDCVEARATPPGEEKAGVASFEDMSTLERKVRYELRLRFG